MHRASGRSAWRCAPGLWLAFVGIVLLGGLSGCSSSRPGGYPAAVTAGDYAPPGPAGDPWGPYIREASAQFGVPEPWVREVMRRESGGRQYIGGSLTTSSAGAMGLMQVMPATYEELRRRHGLGADPYDPRDNILAGTAYIREMYDRFGFPGFLAAYNAGPRRLESYLYAGRPLPGETTAYLAAVAPRLADSAEAVGPLAMYAGAGPDNGADQLNRSMLAALPASRGAPAVAPSPAPAPVYAVAAADSPADDLNRQVLAGAPPARLMAAAYAAPPPAAAAPSRAAAAPERGIMLAAAAPAAASAYARSSAPAFPGGMGGGMGGGTGIQVGAFSSQGQAHAAADAARARSGGLLSATQVAVSSVTRADGAVLYRARLVGLSPAVADAACGQLVQQGVACIVLPPDRAI